jgi:hypothetical protein
MSKTAIPRLEGVGTAWLAAYTLPVTRELVECVPSLKSISPKPVIAVATMGLVPMSPVTDVTPVVVIPVSVKMAKWPAVPRSTESNADAEEARRKKRVMERRSIVKLLVLVWLL